jgi:hypothetical protein
LAAFSPVSHHQASVFPVVVAAIVDLFETLPPFAHHLLHLLSPTSSIPLNPCEYLQRCAFVLRIQRVAISNLAN